MLKEPSPVLGEKKADALSSKGAEARRKAPRTPAKAASADIFQPNTLAYILAFFEIDRNKMVPLSRGAFSFVTKLARIS